MKILILAHRAPCPPDKGDKIRAFHIIRWLAGRHDVWLGAGVDDLADLDRQGELAALCREVCLAPLPALRRGFNMLAGGVTGSPLSVARFRHPKLRRWIQAVLRDVRPDLVWVCSSALVGYVLDRPPETRLIVDFVDADAEKWRAYARAASPPMRWVFAAERRRLERHDRAALRAADAAFAISPTERVLLAALAPECADRLRVLPNGVDTDHLAPAGPPQADGPIVFCGRMDYRPNIDGAAWFAREILPRIRARRPGSRFQIVGAAPTPAVRRLADLPGVEVTGAVADVRPYLAAASVAVAPLRIARGIQNKVLEALASGRPVVATPQALEGIDARPGEELLAAADAEAFSAAVLAILEGVAPPDLAARGRAFVLRRHRWAAHLAELDRLLAGAIHQASAEAAA